MQAQPKKLYDWTRPCLKVKHKTGWGCSPVKRPWVLHKCATRSDYNRPAYAWNPSTWEAETSDCEFKASLSYTVRI